MGITVKNKSALIRSAVIIGIILLSLAAGFIGQKVWDFADSKKYPREYTELVEKYAAQYGVPEYVAYGVMKYESSFVPSHDGEDGKIGLFGIRTSEFDALLKQTMESSPHDALYGPETNIKYGIYQLAGLYNKLGRWETVFAAKAAGMEALDIWLEDKGNFSEAGLFENVPDKTAAGKAESCMEVVKKYREMYYAD